MEKVQIVLNKPLDSKYKHYVKMGDVIRRKEKFIDRICNKLRITELTSMFSECVDEYEFEHDLEEEWYSPDDAILVLERLYSYVDSHPKCDPRADFMLTAFQSIISVLGHAKSIGASFHFIYR